VSYRVSHYSFFLYFFFLYFFFIVVIFVIFGCVVGGAGVLVVVLITPVDGHADAAGGRPDEPCWEARVPGVDGVAALPTKGTY
jgi:hypothetical protein